MREIGAEMLSKWNDFVFVSQRTFKSGLKGEVIERTGWSWERANKVPKGDERWDYIWRPLARQKEGKTIKFHSDGVTRGTERQQFPEIQLIYEFLSQSVSGECSAPQGCISQHYMLEREFMFRAEQKRNISYAKVKYLACPLLWSQGFIRIYFGLESLRKERILNGTEEE